MDELFYRDEEINQLRKELEECRKYNGQLRGVLVRIFKEIPSDIMEQYHNQMLSVLAQSQQPRVDEGRSGLGGDLSFLSPLFTGVIY